MEDLYKSVSESPVAVCLYWALILVLLIYVVWNVGSADFQGNAPRALGENFAGVDLTKTMHGEQFKSIYPPGSENLASGSENYLNLRTEHAVEADPLVTAMAGGSAINAE